MTHTIIDQIVPLFFRMKRMAYLCVLLLVSITIDAQWVTPFGEDFHTPTYYNPSLVGNKNLSDITTSYLLQATEAHRAPQVLHLSASTPFTIGSSKHGVGAFMQTTSFDQQRNTHFALQYSYKWQLWNGFLNLGAQASIWKLQFDPETSVIISDSTANSSTTSLMTPTDEQLLTANVGFSYTTDHLSIGGAVHNVNNPLYTAPTDSVQRRVPIVYNFHVSYNIRIPRTLVEIEPTLRYISYASEPTWNSSLKIGYDKKLWAGTTLVINNNYQVFAGFSVDRLRANYTYIHHTSNMRLNAGDRHQITLSYLLNREKLSSKQPNVVYKSIRFL